MTRTSSPLLVSALALLGACAGDQAQYNGAFDQPVASAVLQPSAGSPFSVPVGYVADRYGGHITPLDLANGIFLADQHTASFVPSQPLATGRDRVLGAIAPYAAGDDAVHLFAADLSYGHLVEIPHVVGRDPAGAPLRASVTATEPVFVDADGSGDDARLTDLRVSNGATSTESWTIERAGERWRVRGSRSGELEEQAETGIPYVGDRGALRFTIEGSGSTGDRFELETSNGLVEHDVGGTPLSLAMAPDQSVLAVVIRDEALGISRLRWFDPATGAVTDADLPAGAAPGRLDWGHDGRRLFVSDAENALFWELVPGQSAVAHDLPWPTLDVAALTSDEGDLLFVVPVAGRSVWIYDLAIDSLRDLNGWRDGVDGMNFTNPVRGIGAIRTPFERIAPDDDGRAGTTTAVAVSLSSGEVAFLEPSGCLSTDLLGPRTEISSSYGRSDYQTSFENVPGSPFLTQNATNGRHIVVNSCGGVAPTETWTLRHRRNLQGWLVEGSVSGQQESLAYEDTRYMSDRGEVSFVLRSGVSPSQDGWGLEFKVLNGLVLGNGENDGVAPREVELILPGDPVAFTVDVGGVTLPYVLVTSEGSDLAARVDPSTGELDVQWW